MKNEGVSACCPDFVKDWRGFLLSILCNGCSGTSLCAHVKHSEQCFTDRIVEIDPVERCSPLCIGLLDHAEHEEFIDTVVPHLAVDSRMIADLLGCHCITSFVMSVWMIRTFSGGVNIETSAPRLMGDS